MILKRLKKTAAVSVIALSLVLGVPTIASAAMAVFDGTMVGKAVEQLRELKAQIAIELEQLVELKNQVMFLNDITSFMNELTDAIGEIATINLPIPNILGMASQIRSDIACLTPDGASWGINLQDLKLSSICAGSSQYRSSLFVNQKDLEGQPFAESEKAWQTVSARRDALLEDSAVRGLAQADVQINQAAEINKAADRLQTDLGSAKTVQDRLHIAAQAQILQARAVANQNQMIAQSLKLQAAAEIKRGMSPSKIGEITGQEMEDDR